MREGRNERGRNQVKRDAVVGIAFLVLVVIAVLLRPAPAWFWALGVLVAIVATWLTFRFMGSRD